MMEIHQINDSCRFKHMKLSEYCDLTPQDKEAKLLLKSSNRQLGIPFKDFDISHVQLLHHDTLVIMLKMKNFVMHTMMIDTRSRIEILFQSTIDQMGLTDQVIPSDTDISGFNSSKEDRTKLIELLDMHFDKENKKVDEQYSKSCQDMSDFKTGLNLENFRRSAGAVLFFKCYHNFDWKSFDSNKVCEIKLARVQIRFHHHHNMFKLSLFVYKCETDEYLPVKFSPVARDGSLSCAFPADIIKNQKMSPNARPFSSSLQYNTKTPLFFSSPPYFPLPLPPPPSPVFEFHPPFAHYFVPLHTGLNLGYEFVYFIRNCGEAGVGVAVAQDEGGAGRVHIVSSYANFGQVGLRPKGDLAAEAYEEFKHALLALIYGKDDQTSPVANEVDIQALAHVVKLTRQGVVDSLEFSKGNLF
ncbi:hypothetical protein GIB67_013536 [Kingdonia uniflora]|uniref:Uncharacterized protein n=1 Tax=Kingdonia uniflora TaxID=39325 RepID=A0A7J7KUU6_9MAGN|nr:hypothetical protein GIB67_013536 [Kingdonia uniflora]